VGLRASDAEPLAQAGELLAVEAIDRSGVLVTSEDALVRALETTPKNPLVVCDAGREQVADAFGRLVNRLEPGQWLQFYVDAAPVHLNALTADGRAQSERAIAAALTGHRRHDPERAKALRALADAHEEALSLHALEQAAIRLRCYVVVPYLPDQHAPALD
jgi:hypothetical protein